VNALYFDHSSTTPIDPRVANVMYQCHLEGLANPASQHRSGRIARKRLEDAKSRIAKLLGIDGPSASRTRLVLTSGGTESNNLALRGWAPEAGDGNVVVSSLEHPSVRETALHLEKSGCEVRWIPANSDGEIDLEAAAQLIDARTRLVSVMIANNETGVVQPINELVAICRTHGVPVHTDAVQAIGRTSIDFHELGVSALSLSAHKFHGPPGVGALVLTEANDFSPAFFGGKQQFGYRPGTETVALAVGMCHALELATDTLAETVQQMQRMRDLLESKLVETHGDTVIHGLRAARRLPHILNVSFPGVDRQALLMALDQKGVACSTGSACASGSSEPSAVLISMGCSEDIVAGSVRFSVGRETTRQQTLRAAEIIGHLVAKLR